MKTPPQKAHELHQRIERYEKLIAWLKSRPISTRQGAVRASGFFQGLLSDLSIFGARLNYFARASAKIDNCKRQLIFMQKKVSDPCFLFIPEDWRRRSLYGMRVAAVWRTVRGYHRPNLRNKSLLNPHWATFHSYPESYRQRRDSSRRNFQ